jgi:hypothetical protein
MILAPLSHRQKQALIPTGIQRAAARNEGTGYADPACPATTPAPQEAVVGRAAKRRRTRAVARQTAQRRRPHWGNVASVASSSRLCLYRPCSVASRRHGLLMGSCDESVSSAQTRPQARCPQRGAHGVIEIDLRLYAFVHAQQVATRQTLGVLPEHTLRPRRDSPGGVPHHLDTASVGCAIDGRAYQRPAQP